MTMISAPLSSAAFFTPALNYLQNNQNALQANTQRLSSGNRIINAADDVAAFSISSQLQSQLSSLKQVNSNIAQGSSLLQVAAGGLQQVGNIIDTMKTIAIQANSSALTDVDRGYLQQQFSTLKDQIDSLASNTSFNNIKLLDGTLAGGNQLLTESSSATKASGSFTLSANPTAGQTVVLNGATFTAGPGNDFAIGVDASASASNLATVLNASTDSRISQATYAANGATITVTAKTGGAAGNNFIIDKAGSTASMSVVGASTVAANVYTLSGGLENGVSAGGTKVTGTINETLLTTQAQDSASVTYTLSGAAADGETISLGDGNGGTVAFTFRNSASTATEIQIGADTEATLQNLVSTISQYSTSSNYGIRQLDMSVSGNSVVFKNKLAGNVTDLSGAALAISEATANGSLSGASFNNGTDGGVNVNGVSGSGFTGTISGFTATYVAADTVDLRVDIGSNTYTARISDTTPAIDTKVRFSSSGGGYFDIQLDGGQGSAVANQTQADSYATRLNAAFSGLSFTQKKSITNFLGTGSLNGATASLQQGTGVAPRINAVSVSAPQSAGTDGVIDFTLGDKTFRANVGLGHSIGAHETVKFTNIANSSEVLSVTNGATALDFSTANAAATLQTALTSAFHIDTPGTGTDFQVGLDASNTLNVSIGSVSSFSLFGGETPDVSSQADALAAQSKLDTARQTVQSLLATVAGKQTSLNYAAANLQQTITAVSQANSALADTDIAAESTDYALNTVKVNAGIAVLAQAMALPNGLLMVLRAAGKG